MKPMRAVAVVSLSLSLQTAAVMARPQCRDGNGKTDESRRWLLTVLRTPRLGILTTAPGGWDMLDLTDDGPPTALDAYDHNDRNWWCPYDRHLLALRDSVDYITGNGAAAIPE